MGLFPFFVASFLALAQKPKIENEMINNEMIFFIKKL
jgi:hypothetical protein